jgi:hypothetical protein
MTTFIKWQKARSIVLSSRLSQRLQELGLVGDVIIIRHNYYWRQPEVEKARHLGFVTGAVLKALDRLAGRQDLPEPETEGIPAIEEELLEVRAKVIGILGKNPADLPRDDSIVIYGTVDPLAHRVAGDGTRTQCGLKIDLASPAWREARQGEAFSHSCRKCSLPSFSCLQG